MIQFNLLPDIKIQYLKAKRQKRMVVVTSIVASAAALAIFLVLLSTVFVLQKKNLSDLNKDISSTSNQLKSVKDLDKILTVQNQLKALPQLHDQKVVSSRLLDYLTQLTPAGATVTKLDVDFQQSTMSITGTSADVATMTKFTDTLKYAQYQLGDNNDKKNAFSQVVLQSLTRDEKSATYQIVMSFDAAIFTNASEVKLTVPAIVTTPSATERPATLQDTTTQNTGQGQ